MTIVSKLKVIKAYFHTRAPIAGCHNESLTKTPRQTLRLTVNQVLSFSKCDLKLGPLTFAQWEEKINDFYEQVRRSNPEIAQFRTLAAFLLAANEPQAPDNLRGYAQSFSVGFFRYLAKRYPINQYPELHKDNSLFRYKCAFEVIQINGCRIAERIRKSQDYTDLLAQITGSTGEMLAPFDLRIVVGND